MAGKVFKVDVSEEVAVRLASSARDSHRNETEIVEQAIAEYLDRQEMELAAVEQGMVRAAKDGLISHEAMKAWLSSWGMDHELAPPDADIVRLK